MVLVVSLVLYATGARGRVGYDWIVPNISGGQFTRFHASGGQIPPDATTCSRKYLCTVLYSVLHSNLVGSRQVRYLAMHTQYLLMFPFVACSELQRSKLHFIPRNSLLYVFWWLKRIIPYLQLISMHILRTVLSKTTSKFQLIYQTPSLCTKVWRVRQISGSLPNVRCGR